MGINAETAIAISYLRRNAIVDDDIFCLGRPEMFVTKYQLAKINKAAKLGLSFAEVEAITAEKFADVFLRKLGFIAIRTIDASSYEGADIIHDLNTPVPEEWRGTVRFLYDGGTLEHVFDIATAFKNVISLLSIGGVALFAPPANSQCGHGFYQFSPELFYRLLQTNGFDDVVVYVASTVGPQRWFKAVDPRAVKRRAQFMSSEALQLIVIARKARNVPAFVNPQQSDYSDIEWTKSDNGSKREDFSILDNMRFLVINRMAYPMQILLRHTTGFCFGTGMPGLWRRSLFERVDPFHHRLFERH
jgi:hypothetical protein